MGASRSPAEHALDEDRTSGAVVPESHLVRRGRVEPKLVRPAGIAQRLSSERLRAALVLRIVAGVLYLGSAVFYVSMPRGTKPGEKCPGGLGSCTTEFTARQCQGGVIVEVPCRGPKGCFNSGALAMTCDVSVARDGEPCMSENEGKFACSEDHRAGLLCQRHRFERSRECTGPRGCFVANGTQIACDMAEQE